MKRALAITATLGVLAVLDVTLARVLNPYVFRVLMLCGINVILAVSLNLVNGFTGQFSIGHAGFMAVGAYTSAVFTLHAGRPWVAGLEAAGVPAPLATSRPLSCGDSGGAGAAGLMAMLCVTCAAGLKLALPAWSAATTHDPVETMLTVVPLMLHTPGVVAL